MSNTYKHKRHGYYRSLNRKHTKKITRWREGYWADDYKVVYDSFFGFNRHKLTGTKTWNEGRWVTYTSTDYDEVKQEYSDNPNYKGREGHGDFWGYIHPMKRGAYPIWDGIRTKVRNELKKVTLDNAEESDIWYDEKYKNDYYW